MIKLPQFIVFSKQKSNQIHKIYTKLQLQMGNKNQAIFYDCGSKYIGQTLNHQPHRKGMLYIDKRSISFNSEISTDQNTLNVIETQFINGKIEKVGYTLKNGFKFKGTLLDQNQIQQGRLIDTQYVQYEGIFQKGKIKKGKITSLPKKQNNNLISYICQTEGQFIGTSIIHGQGLYYNITEKYIASGEFYKGKLLKGIYLYGDGSKYEGQFSQGVMNGRGRYHTNRWAIKSDTKGDEGMNIHEVKYEKDMLRNHNEVDQIQFCYQGSFDAGLPSGKGKVMFQNGHSYKGKFKNGRYQGQGQYKFSDGTFYKGVFYGGQMSGDCKIDFTQSSKINLNRKRHQILQRYEGQVSNGIFHGLGILYYQNGVIFKGHFLNGAKNGPGVLIYGESKFKCLYVMNKLVGELKAMTDQ